MRAPGSDAEPPPTARPKGWRGRPAGTGGHTGAPTGPQRRLYGPRSPRESGPPVGEEAIRRAADTLASGAAVRATVPRDRPTGGPPNPWRTDPVAGHSSQPEATKTGSGGRCRKRRETVPWQRRKGTPGDRPPLTGRYPNRRRYIRLTVRDRRAVGRGHDPREGCSPVQRPALASMRAGTPASRSAAALIRLRLAHEAATLTKRWSRCWRSSTSRIGDYSSAIHCSIWARRLSRVARLRAGTFGARTAVRWAATAAVSARRSPRSVEDAAPPPDP
jgi:hypothetical protein